MPHSSQLLNRVAGHIRDRQLFSPGDRVLVAVSGGADSLALLHILHELDLGLELLAAYIDHGLRPAETPGERLLVAAHCAALGRQCLQAGVDALAVTGHSREEAARLLRYSALEQLRREHDAQAIAVAHTADDQVEEFFIRLTRGAGVKGLSGMAPRHGRLVRPLLGVTKAELIAYLQGKGLSWAEDSSNRDHRFLRNRVRHQLLPLLEQEYSPAIRRTVLQTMDILAEEEGLLAALAAQALTRAVRLRPATTGAESVWPVVIRGDELLAEYPAIQRRVVESCCWHLGVRPSYPQIIALLELLAGAVCGAELHLADGVRARKTAAGLLLGRPLAKGALRGASPAAPAVHLKVPAPGVYHLPGHGHDLVIVAGEAPGKSSDGRLLVDQARVSFPMLLRSVQAGERIQLDQGSKKILRYFNEKKIPVWQRPAWPLLEDRDGIIALPGLTVDLGRRVTSATGQVYTLIWRRTTG